VILGAARAKDGRDLRRGQVYALPARGSAVVAPVVTRAAAPHDPRAALLVRLRAEKKRVARLASALAGDLVKHGDPAAHERDGELLKSVLGSITRGMTSIAVIDYGGAGDDAASAGGQERSIALDPKKDGKGNLAAAFARAKKARTAIARTAPRAAEAQARVSALENAIAVLAGPASSDDERAAQLAEAERALADDAAAPSKRRAVAKEVARSGRAGTQSKRQPWRAFKVSRDVVVRVGRGAKDNDLLVKSARGHDVWLHARERSGGHVIIPSRGEDVAPEVLLDAAHLAAHFSAARGEPRVDVQHTRVKNLKKPGPGAAPGLFLVAHETVLHLRVDEARVRALLSAEVPA
jgi:predicted ribosome quality control (RQC) complex YloA/Tae2 family protein